MIESGWNTYTPSLVPAHMYPFLSSVMTRICFWVYGLFKKLVNLYFPFSLVTKSSPPPNVPTHMRRYGYN